MGFPDSNLWQLLTAMPIITRSYSCCNHLSPILLVTQRWILLNKNSLENGLFKRGIGYAPQKDCRYNI
ncbi:hypothetical protein F0562_026090 [Nyssa sinensis]|uniref:Uncharacterized protein n=1 Tax=Nyssa sinensis TaxID=561372 RepID=A0A5J5B9V3_9ASTE|nr:hypothetical protein F0562_026090 [Nyssa sinensis]